MRVVKAQETEERELQAQQLKKKLELKAQQHAMHVQQLEDEHEIQVNWSRKAIFFEEELEKRKAKEINTKGFAEAVDAMRRKLSAVFPWRSECILFYLPTEFILDGGKSSNADVMVRMERMLEMNRRIFHDFKGIEDFDASFVRVFPSIVAPIETTATTSTGIEYDHNTNLITVTTIEPSEFHPTSTLVMRDSYWPILRMLPTTSAAVVIGDPGIGKSSLLRVVYELFVYKRPENLKEAAKRRRLLTDDSAIMPFSRWKGVFWIMESGQFHYAWKQATGTIVQPRSPTCLVASPQPANYNRMMKASNVVRLTLPPWSKDEVQDLLKQCKKVVRTRMQPYVNYILSKVDSNDNTSAQSKNKASESAQENATNSEDEKSDNVNMDCAIAESNEVDNKMDEDTFEPMHIDSSQISMATKDTAVSNGGSGVIPLAKSACNAWDYDDVSALRQALEDNDREAKWSFLQKHILWRYQLVGGRIRLLLNPAETSTTLKKQVASAIHAVSIDNLQDESSIDSHCYVPSVLYSLVPSTDPRDPPEARFASTTISCLVLGRLARAKCDSLVRFLAAEGGGSIFGSILGHVVEEFVHQNLPRGHKVLMKYLPPPVSNKAEKKVPEQQGQTVEVTLPAMELVTVDFPSKLNLKTAKEEVSTPRDLDIKSNIYYKPTSVNEPQVDSLMLCSDPILVNGQALPRLLLFQAQISSKHLLIPHDIEELTSKLHYDGKPQQKDQQPNQNHDPSPEYALVFVIHRDNMDTFQYQTRLRVNKRPLESAKRRSIPQYALALTDDLLQHLRTCVQEIADELRLNDVVGAI